MKPQQQIASNTQNARQRAAAKLVTRTRTSSQTNGMVSSLLIAFIKFLVALTMTLSLSAKREKRYDDSR